MKIGVFMDVSNLYYCVGHKFEGKKLSYQKYLDYLKDIGELTIQIAYGSQMGNEAFGFMKCLRNMGFETKFKKPKEITTATKYKRKADWDVGITIDIVSMLDKLDMIVLGSADSDLAPVVEVAKTRGKKVIVFACGVSSELHMSATQVVEIYEGLLE